MWHIASMSPIMKSTNSNRGNLKLTETITLFSQLAIINYNAKLA